MTKEQQTKVDRFHERVIALMLRRSQAMRYNNYREEEKITAEINLVEEERRRYERDCQQQRQEKREIARSVPEAQTGEVAKEAETKI